MADGTDLDRNPFAGLGGRQDDEPGPDPSFNPWANLGRTDLPRFEAPKPTRFIDLIMRPQAAFPALARRAKDVAADEFRHGTLAGGAALSGADVLTGGLDATNAALSAPGNSALQQALAADAKRRRIADEKAARPREAGSLAEGITDFGAGVAGTILSPESWFDAPIKGLEIAGRPIVSRIIRRGVGAGVANAATDPAVQGVQIARGVQDDYNPFQTLAAGAMGFAAGAGLEGARFAHEVGKAAKDLKDPFYALATGRLKPPETDPNLDALRRGPATADALWGRLVQQESGGDQSATSNKGARGVAQLMPETAQDVAERLGRPELAKVALGDGPAAAVANELLGKTYLNELLKQFDGDPVLALAAYNAGPGRVRKWIDTFGHPDQVGRARWLAMVPFDETRNYVHAILGDVAGARHTLTPEDQEYMRGRMPEFPEDAEKEIPPLERAAQAFDEADQIRSGRTRADLTPEQRTELSTLEQTISDFISRHYAGERGALGEATSLEQIMRKKYGDVLAGEEDFPGDRPATGEGPVSESIPWDDEPAAPENFEPTSPKENSEGPDLIDRALDQLRSGKPVQLGEGPSLIEALVKAGGVKDEGGELTALLGGQGENRLFKMLRKVTKGMSLDDAAQWAQERGYIGRPDLTERASIQDLLNAIEREVRGEKVYPPDRINEDARLLQEHVQDLDEVLNHIGIDPAKMTNPEIREAMDRWMRQADEQELEPGSLGMADTGEVLGMGGKAAMATGNEAVRRAREAAQRLAWRDQIVASTRRGQLRGARAPGAVDAPRNAAGDIDLSKSRPVKNVPDIIRTLADKLGYPVRQGRIAMRNALGTYNRVSGMVRSKGRYDINVLAHEFGHALEFTDGHGLPNVVAAMKKHSRALKLLDYNQAQIGRGGKTPEGRRYEGFAEWFRWYITNPEYADSVPGGRAFREDFEAAMQQDAPESLAAIREAQQDYQTFLEAPSLEATRSHVIAPPPSHWLPRLFIGAGFKPGIERGKLNDVLERKGFIGAMKEVSDEAYRGVMDFLHPWQRAVEFGLDRIETVHGVRPKLAAVADPYKILRSMPAVAAQGHMDLLHGVHGYHSLEPDSPSFVEALTLALGDKFLRWDEDAINQFGTYLVGRRVLNLYDQVGRVWTDAEGRRHGMEAPPDALSRAAWAKTVADLEEANPQWADAAQMLYEWNNALWRKRFDGGLITEGQYMAGLEDHPNYVPLFRDISDKEFGGDVGGQRGSATKGAGGVVQLKGSDRAYINPLHSMMNMAYELNAQLARNDALKALDDLAMLVGPDMGQVVERIKPNEIRGVQTSVEEVIANAAKQFGISRRDAAAVTDAVRDMFDAEADDSLAATVYRAQATGERGEPIVYMWRDGERVPLRLPDGKWGRDMVEGLAGMTPPIRSVFLDFAAIPAAALRAGVTAHPAFFLANSFRDQLTAFVLTNVGYRPFWDQMRGLGHEVSNHIPGMEPDELSRLYNVVGGEIGGYQSAAAHMAQADKNLQALRQKGKSIRHFATWDGFARFTELSETGTRLGIFERAMKDAKARGMSDFAAAREAAFEARDYMDFDRHGAWTGTRILARVIPFMNAGLQALDKTRRVSGLSKQGVSTFGAVIRPLFGDGPPATAEQYREFSHAMKLWITAGSLAAGGLALRAAYRDDPEYQEVADQVRNTHWVVKLPNGYFAVIPKPYEIAVLSNVFERAYEAAALHDPTAWKRLGQGLEDIFIPAHDPAFIMPIINIMRNRDNLGSPIVPDYLKARLPRDQYTDRTSDMAKWLGAHLGGEEGVSPAVIDYLAKSWGGSNVRDVLDANRTKAPVAESPADTYVMKRFVKDWTRGAVSSKEFYDRTSASDGKWTASVNSMNGLINNGDYPEAIRRLKTMDAPERAFVMASVFAAQDHHGENDRHENEFAKQDHPMIRAAAASRVFSGLARDLQDGNVRGPDLKPISVTPEQRRDAIRALRELSVAEQRNSMILAGVEGWANRPPLPQSKYLVEFQRAAPQLVPALLQRYQADKVQDIGTTAQNWSAWRKMVETAHDDATLTRMMEAKRFGTTKRGDLTAAAMQRAMSDVVPVAR